jgi:hypothetical protein
MECGAGAPHSRRRSQTISYKQAASAYQVSVFDFEVDIKANFSIASNKQPLFIHRDAWLRIGNETHQERASRMKSSPLHHPLSETRNTP